MKSGDSESIQRPDYCAHTSRSSLRAMALFLVGILAMSGCSSPNDAQTSSQQSNEVLEISAVAVNVNAQFIGTASEFKSEKIEVEWQLNGFQSLAELEEGCYRLFLSTVFPPLAAYGQEGFELETELKLRNISDLGASKFSSLVSGPEAPTLLDLARHPAGAIFQFSVQLYQWPKDVDGYCPVTLVTEGSAGGELATTSTETWLRPKHDSSPSAPILTVELNYPDSNEPCSIVRDTSAHRFTSFPTFATWRTSSKGNSSEVRGSVDDPTERMFNGYIDSTCNRADTEVAMEVGLTNSAGESDVVKLEFIAHGPSVTAQQLEAEQRERKIADCLSVLSITEFDLFSCGLLSTEVFQYDLNTGPCNFLGYWTDSSGSEKVGFFEFCENLGGSVSEGFGYTFHVRNNGPIDYVNSFGSSKRVLHFTVIAQG